MKKISGHIFRFLTPVILIPVMAAAIFVVGAFVVSTGAGAASRIKDIVDFEGIRENPLVGYGLVVGLDGTGDTLQNAPFTQQSIQAMLERLGINTRGGKMRTDNVAAVMVTANLPPFARQGSRMDVVVSSLGDADSLRGGTLLVTPLLGADGEVYGVAQGTVAVGGFSVEGDSASVSKGVVTGGRIASGGVVEREIAFSFASLNSLNLSLRNPDLTTANRIAQAINDFTGTPTAAALDPGTVHFTVPPGSTRTLVAVLAEIEQLSVEPDIVAKVVIDENSGIIVMGSNVHISTVAIAQGNLTIRVTETPQVSQPEPFSTGGQTQTVPRTAIQIDEGEDERLAVLNPGVTLQELVDGLNALGIGPRDMISILQALKIAGALQAEIEVM